MGNPDITVGAQLAAAGKMLGMSPDETVDFYVQQMQRNNAKRARQGLPPISDERGFQAFLAKMGRVADINEELYNVMLM